MQEAGLNAVPIVALMAFLIGVVLAFQGAAQLRQFGAEIFVVDLIADLDPARARHPADRDHRRRPLGLGLHRRHRLDEDARGDRRDAHARPRSDRAAGAAARAGAGHHRCRCSGSSPTSPACSAARLMAWIELGISPAMFRTRLVTDNDLVTHASSASSRRRSSRVIIGAGRLPPGPAGRRQRRIARPARPRVAVVVAIFLVIVPTRVFSIFFAGDRACDRAAADDASSSVRGLTQPLRHARRPREPRPRRLPRRGAGRRRRLGHRQVGAAAHHRRPAASGRRARSRSSAPTC